MMANLNGSSSIDVVQMNADNVQTTMTASSSVDELQKVNDFFEANASAIERWLKEKASDEVINRLNFITKNKNENREQVHRSSVTSELYQQWLSSSMKVSSHFLLRLLAIRLKNKNHKSPKYSLVNEYLSTKSPFVE